jgi:hypothetical protein
MLGSRNSGGGHVGISPWTRPDLCEETINGHVRLEPFDSKGSFWISKQW